MKKMIRRGFIVVMVAMLARYSVWSQGTIFVSNLGQPSAGSLTVGSDSWLAESIGTGNNPGGYALDSVQLAMTPASGSPSGFMVMLYSAAVGAQVLPGSSLGTLTASSSDPMAGGLYTYTASGLTLSPETDYFIVLTAGTRLASGAYAWSFENTSTGSSSGGWGRICLLSSPAMD